MNPFGFKPKTQKSTLQRSSRDQRAHGPLNDQIMSTTVRNLTNSRAKVTEFIEKEEMVERKKKLHEIFTLTRLIVDRFDGCKISDMTSSSDYKALCQPAFARMREQRHAGRKLFLCMVSNPVFGLETIHFMWFFTQRGVSAGQLEMLDAFIDKLKGIKQEPLDEKPQIGMINVPKSKKSSTAGKNHSKSGRNTDGSPSEQFLLKSIDLDHTQFKTTLENSVKTVLKQFNIPLKNVEHVIDTAELSNRFSNKINLLVNINLVAETTTEPLEITSNSAEQPADWVLTDSVSEDTPKQAVDADGFWSDSSDTYEKYEAEFVRRNNNNNATSKTKILLNPAEECLQQFRDSNRVLKDTIQRTDRLKKLIDTISDVNYKPKPRNSVLDQSMIQMEPSAVSTPTSTRTDINKFDKEEKEKEEKKSLPKPNDSIASNSSGSFNESIHTSPLGTPKPLKRVPRQSSLQVAPMPVLESESEADTQSPRVQKPRNIVQLVDYIDQKFSELEKSFSSKK